MEVIIETWGRVRSSLNHVGSCEVGLLGHVEVIQAT